MTRFNTQIIIFLLSITLSFAGCATTHLKEDDFIPANKLEDPAPEPVSVILPTPEKVERGVSIDSQLKELENFEGLEEKKKISPARAIDRANRKAAQNPSSDNFINAITVYGYMPGVLYQIYTSPAHITDIMLQPGEELTTAPAAGDTVRWMVGDTASGSGANRRVHVLVKPVSPRLHTNIVITTNRHTYHLEARSFKTTYQAAVSWNYPHDEFNIMKQRISEKNERIRNIITSVKVSDLNFGYRIKGKAKWKPVRVFDDGEKTYIKFPERVEQAEIPPLFILSREKKAQIVNYRYNHHYYIVDRIFDAALLQIGEKKQEKVYIYRNSTDTL